MGIEPSLFKTDTIGVPQGLTSGGSITSKFCGGIKSSSTFTLIAKGSDRALKYFEKISL